MTSAQFLALLKKSSDLAFDFAKEFIIDELMPSYKYSVTLNISFDDPKLKQFDIYPTDNNKIIDNISDEDVVKLLCRNEKIPVWIDISVENINKEQTIFRLLCAGRYSNDESEFYYNTGGTGPFGIKSPTFPLNYIKGQKFKLPSINHPSALITGASQGLGRAFAAELAKRKTNLILVSLPNENLASLAAQLADFQIIVHYFETDLSLRENVESLAQNINKNFQVNILINNAGRGGTRRFETAEPNYLDGVLQLNITATVLLTRLLLPNLRQQKQAHILNVSSMAAFSPIGYKTVYPASKAFIRHWSLGLREELRGDEVSVSVVYPGPMATNTDASQRIEKQGFKGKIGLVSPEEVARIALRRMFKGKATIIPGFMNKLTRLLMALLPNWLKIPLISRAIKKELMQP